MNSHDGENSVHPRIEFENFILLRLSLSCGMNVEKSKIAFSNHFHDCFLLPLTRFSTVALSVLVEGTTRIIIFNCYLHHFLVE